MRVWNLADDGKCTHVLQQHSNVVMDVALFQVGDISAVLSASMDGHVLVWRLQDGGQGEVLHDHVGDESHGGVQSIAVSSNCAGEPKLACGQQVRRYFRGQYEWGLL